MSNVIEGLICTNDNCVGCNRCISACSCPGATIAAETSDGKNIIKVDGSRCVACGACLDVCEHHAREYIDDTMGFFADLKKGEDISILIAPAFFANYPNEYKEILGKLKALGVNRIISVGFGADITTWAYLNYISKNNFKGGISQPCPATVDYIEKYIPELIPKLMPVQSPVMCAAIYAKKHMGLTGKMALISPCIAKKSEIMSSRGKGLISYNVTFNHLMKQLGKMKVSPIDYDDTLEQGLGSVYPMPGGLGENIYWFLGEDAGQSESITGSDSCGKISPLALLFHPEYAFADKKQVLSQKEQSLCEIQNMFFSGQLEEAYYALCVLASGEKDDRFLYCLSILKMFILVDLGKREEILIAQRELASLNHRVSKYSFDTDFFSFYFGEKDFLPIEVYSGEIYEEYMPLLSALAAKRGLNELVHNGASAGYIHYEIICKELESKNCPLISAYYHIYLAVYMNAIGRSKEYDYHIRKAASILLPKGWYIPLAEYSSTIDLSFISKIDSKAYKTIALLSRKIIGNYVEVGVFEPSHSTPKKNDNTIIQVGYLILQGKSNEDIASELGMSVYKVRKYIDELSEIVGSTSKKEIKNFVLRNFVI